MAASGLRVIQVCSARNIVYGAVRSMLALGSGLKLKGVEVQYLTFSGRGAGPALREQGETVFEAPVRGKIDPFGIVKMARIMRDQKVDLVHTHLSTSSTNGALAARLAKVPSIATVHGMSGKLSFVFANHLIAVSNQVKEHLVKQGMAASKISVVYNGIEFPDVSSDTVLKLKNELGITDAFPVIGTVARVTPLKGIEYAIEAMVEVRAKFPKAVYLILGDGDGVEACKALVSKLGLGETVKFLGYQVPVEPYLATMDLLAFPSLKEAMGIALVEAAGHGVPAVATSVGGIPEVVTEDVGLLVPPRDSQAMASGLIELASQNDLRGRMSLAARKRARTIFSQEAMVRSTLGVYGHLLGRELTESEPQVARSG